MAKPLAIPRSHLNPRYLVHDYIFGWPITKLGRVINMRPVPNVLTMLRFALCGPFFYFLYETLFQYSATNLWWTILLMFLIGLTDCLDGYIAHKFEGCYSAFGAKYDPLADKLAVFGSYCIFGIWFLSTSPGDEVTYPQLLCYIALIHLYVCIVIYRAAQDVESTVLYFRYGGSSIMAGKVKFVLDLLAQALGLLGAYLVNLHDRSSVSVLILMTSCAALASLFGRMSLIAKYAALRQEELTSAGPNEQLPSLIEGFAQAHKTFLD